MDWARDYAGLSDKDLNVVFRYEERSTTVVQMLSHQKTPLISSLNGENDWYGWLKNDCPNIDDHRGVSGLIFILAKRTGEPSFASIKKAKSNDWLEHISMEKSGRSETQGSDAFAAMSEKPSTSGRRGVRTLPFSKDVFSRITRSFHVHSSIARVISRTDIPVFDSARVKMEGDKGNRHDAYVYNCRSTNAWDMDLALTATYFPHCNITFSILFGCPLLVEKEILRRLSFAMAEAAHPLLSPGIFAELERSRHVKIVASTINDLETRIFELDSVSQKENISGSEAEERNQGKRTAWLDTTYLRNALISWNTQLKKICENANELEHTLFEAPDHYEHTHDVPGQNPELLRSRTFDRPITPDIPFDETPQLAFDKTEVVEVEGQGKTQSVQAESRQCTPVRRRHLRRTGIKISHRIQGIIDEYDDKIRDCTMRIDGMAMATQWAHSETNVEIALATGRDSRHMRSIALVTMIFLPGTFLATVFSMTFFNWFGASNDSVVSKWIWIYVLITIICTALTVGSWWYFVAYRQSKRRKPAVEEEVPLV